MYKIIMFYSSKVGAKKSQWRKNLIVNNNLMQLRILGIHN